MGFVRRNYRIGQSLTKKSLLMVRNTISRWRTWGICKQKRLLKE